MTDSTRRHMPDAAFPSHDAIPQFFAELGFAAAARPQLDGSFALRSAGPAGASDDDLAALRASRQIWTLRLCT